MQGNLAVASRPSKLRSALTNDPRRLAVDIDMRSVEGRRFADIFDALRIEFGPSADPGRLREIAVLKFELEKAQASGACALEDIVRVHNLIVRKERELRLAEQKRRLERDRGGAEALREHLAKYEGAG